MSDNKSLSILRLIRSEGVGPTTYKKFIQEFGTVEKALEALPNIRHRGKTLTAYPMNAAKQEFKALQDIDGYFILHTSEYYPEPLANINDAPPLLSAIGNKDLLQKPMLAIVGARNASVNGRRLAARMAKELGEAGFVIVSGLARGIDFEAHQSALETGTIAVLANGIDIIYPPENKKLYDAIAEQGLLLSENSFGLEPNAQLFPRRNRIVSGLCKGVIVIEAAVKSGSLITTQYALDQGREVFAVPGNPLDPRATGPNGLIKRGAAHLVESAQDVLDQLSGFPSLAVEQALKAHDPPEEEPTLPINSMTDDQAYHAVLNCLSHSACMIDDIIAATHLPAAHVQSILLQMELKGQLQRMSGNRVARS